MIIMNKYLCIIIICFFGCSIFSTDQDKSNLDKNLIDSNIDIPFFSMKRTPCYGKCPTYNISFFSDGKIIYEGKKFVTNEGKYLGQLNIKTVALIQDKIRQVDFFNLDSVYDARISDLPSVILEVNMDGSNHKVIDRYKGPIKLREFEKYIDSFILKLESGLLGDSWEKVNE